MTFDELGIEDRIYDGPRPDEIVIEIDCEDVVEQTHRRRDTFDSAKWINRVTRIVNGNGKVFWFPTDDMLRGRIRLDRVQGCTLSAERRDAFLRYAPRGIPGQCVHVDIEKREGRITDALGWKENRPMREQLTDAALHFEDSNFLLLPPAEEKIVNLTEDRRFHTWLFWMVRLLGNTTETHREVSPVQNVERLPSLKEIIKTRNVKASWNGEDPRVSEAMKIDQEHRMKKTGNQEAYAYDGCLTPAMFDANMSPPRY